MKRSGITKVIQEEHPEDHLSDDELVGEYAISLSSCEQAEVMAAMQKAAQV